MKINGPQLPPQVDRLSSSPQAVVDAWKVGQLIRATAVTPQSGGQATINVGGTLLLAQTQYPLKAGQPLQLEVSGLSANTLLKVVGAAASKGVAITLSLPPQPALLSQLQTGQLLQATLPRPVDATQTRALLQLAGQQVSAQLSQPLPSTSGQSLKLEVISPGALPALRILAPASTGSSPDIQQALRNILPRQTPLTPLLANLALVATSASRGTPLETSSGVEPAAGPRRNLTLPQPLVALAREVIERLPGINTVTSADGLKQAVAQSGLFTEARMAQALKALPPGSITTPNLPLDFKGSLLSLLVSLLTLTKTVPGGAAPPAQPQATPNAPATPPHNPTLPSSPATLHAQMTQQHALLELLRHVEGGLARLQLSQLISHAHEEDGRRSWVMELPVANNGRIDLIQLHIEKEQKGHSKNQPPLWNVNLSLELPTLGPLQARITLAGETIHTQFWADSAQTTQLIKAHLPTLQQRYREVGLTVGTLNAQTGAAPQSPAPDANLPHVLLDVQA